MRIRVSTEQKMRVLGIFLCVTAFPAWLAGKVRREFLRRLTLPELLLRTGCAAQIGDGRRALSWVIGCSYWGRSWRVRTAAAPRLAPIPLEHSPCRR